MKKENSILHNIKDTYLNIFDVWREELRMIFKDAGVMIFFFLVPFIYPLLYSFIYNNEVVREAKLVVVDRDDTYLSREFTRRVNATPDVEIIAVCADMAEAKRMLDEKRAYGIMSFPSDFSDALHEGRQAHVSLYCDMSALLFYKAFLLSATEVSLDMGKEIRKHASPSSTDKMDQIMINPIPYESVAMFNTPNGFASFLVPAILILVLQQTLILGIGMLGGTIIERSPARSLIPMGYPYRGTVTYVIGKAIAYLMLYILVCVWVLVIVPRLFSLPQIGDPMVLTLFILPYLLAAIFMSMTLASFMTTREAPMMVFVFTSVLFLFISGVSWPEASVPPFWKALGYLFPSTPGVQGFIRINTSGAILHDVSKEYILLWIQAGVYFLTTCAVYRKHASLIK